MSQRRRRSGRYSGRRGGKSQWAPAESPTPAPPIASPAQPPIRARQPAVRPRRIWPWILLAVALLLAVPVGYLGFNIAPTLGPISSNYRAGGGLGAPHHRRSRL